MKRLSVRLLLGLIILGAIGYTGFTYYMKAKYANFQFQMPPATVIVQNVMPRPFADRIDAIGTTEANESTNLTANVTETVRTIQFTEGQYVTAGTVLVSLNDDEERAAVEETQKNYDRSVELAKTNAASAARRDQDKARLEIARAKLADRTITAPFDGVLGLRSISVGGMVNPGTVITTIDDVDPIKLTFSVPESFMGAITADLAIESTSEAYPGVVFNGVIKAVDTRVDTVTRTIKAKAEIPNPDRRLRPGMLMSVTVIKNPRQALAVSEETLVSQGEQHMVMVASAPDKDGISTIEPRPVTLGARMPGYVEIMSGLNQGDQVVVDGVIKSFPGAKVKIGGTKTIDDTVQSATSMAVPGKQEELDQAKPLPAPAE